YVSSANYINKMSNYCSSCHYSHTKKIGENACPFNALYWNFLDAKREHFSKNNRMAMMMNLLNKKNKTELSELKTYAQRVIESPDNY
ncbi:MAG: cryptochrome/photolyase family protein, partial [Maribacter sp.]